MVAGMSVSGDDEKVRSLSVSVGASLVEPGETAEKLIQRADKMMYKSKTSGRGRATTD
jgi:PleD family two-component response regulator